MDMNTAIEALAALSHDTRLRVFRLLVQAGPAGVAAGDIAERLDARQNTMSSHLKQLNYAGLVNSRREGRHILYTANFKTVRDLIRFLMEDCCAGSAEVSAPFAVTNTD